MLKKFKSLKNITEEDIENLTKKLKEVSKKDIEEIKNEIKKETKRELAFRRTLEIIALLIVGFTFLFLAVFELFKDYFATILSKEIYLFLKDLF